MTAQIIVSLLWLTASMNLKHNGETYIAGQIMQLPKDTAKFLLESGLVSPATPEQVLQHLQATGADQADIDAAIASLGEQAEASQSSLLSGLKARLVANQKESIRLTKELFALGESPQEIMQLMAVDEESASFINELVDAMPNEQAADASAPSATANGQALPDASAPSATANGQALGDANNASTADNTSADQADTTETTATAEPDRQQTITAAVAELTKKEPGKPPTVKELKLHTGLSVVTAEERDTALANLKNSEQ